MMSVGANTGVIGDSDVSRAPEPRNHEMRFDTDSLSISSGNKGDQTLQQQESFTNVKSAKG